MKIKIISDSTCDLSKELIEQNDITLFPLIVNKGEKSYLDGVDIFPDEIFAHVANGGSLCSTAARGIGAFEELFSEYSPKYDAVFHITIGSGFSSNYQNAVIAAQDFENVYVIDSQNLSTGQGLVVLKACELARTCESPDAMQDALNAFTKNVEASFLLDRLDYMVKGGRCSAVAALGANLLKLKPCIEVRNGKMSVVKKYRGSYDKCLAAYVQDRLADRDDLQGDILFATNTPITDACRTAIDNAIAAYGKFDTIYRTTAGCTISCHCGPGCFGVLFVRK